MQYKLLKVYNSQSNSKHVSFLKHNYEGQSINSDNRSISQKIWRESEWFVMQNVDMGKAYSCHRSTVWLGSSVVRVLARYARGPGFESRSGHVLFSSPVTFGGSVWVRAQAASSKGTVSSVPAWFRADSETNLIKQGEIVTGRPCGSVAQWSECSHGMREVLGSSPGRAMCFFLPLWHSCLKNCVFLTTKFDAMRICIQHCAKISILTTLCLGVG